MNLIHCILVLTLTAFTIARAPPIEVVFFIQGQDTKYHNELSRNLKEDINQQSTELHPKYRIEVHVLHEIINYPGDWTIHNLIPKLVLLKRKSHINTNMQKSNTANTNQQIEIINENTRWIVFCEEQTKINLKFLIEKLKDENYTQPMYLGHPLYDREPTIVHHFAFFENPKWFPYPMLRAGVVFSMPLFKSIANFNINHNENKQLQRSEFSIDAAHELAHFIYDNLKISSTNASTASSSNKHENKTRTTSSSNEDDISTANMVTKKQKIILNKASYICPTVTWETGSVNSKNRSKKNKDYNENGECATYAEKAALSMTCTTNTGIPNVEMGHCAKTLQILKLALKDIENYNKKQHRLHNVNEGKYENQQIKWLFLADDDTLLSVSGVCQVIGCYNSMNEIYLGERYGYRLYAEDGFNYITGGSGIAFSLPVVKLILKHCSCSSPTAPDDMILGSCLHSLQVKAIHSSRFHQARPNDYPLELLQLESPISFHKFWQLEPIEVYNQWFAAQDHQLLLKENIERKNLIELDYSSKNRKLLAKTEPLNFNEIPVSLVSSLHHSKEGNDDL